MTSRLAALVLVSTLAACSSDPEPEALACATPDDAAAAADVTITSQESMLKPGDKDFLAWTFDGDVPGPVLRIPLGEKRRIKLVNRTPRPTSLHFHGVSYAAEDDGSPEQPKSIVNPGCAHVYTVTANAAGVWPFHSHRESRTELSRGLYGAVVVPEKNEAKADHEFVVFLGQLGLEGEGMEGMSHEEAEHAAGAPPFFMTINGRPNAEAKVIELKGDHYEMTDGTAEAKVGDRVRWRVLNVAPDEPHTFHLHGHRWCDRGGLVEASGSCPAGGALIDNTPMLPAEGRTLEFVEDAEGEWMYHCHVIDHVVDGMYAMYRVTK